MPKEALPNKEWRRRLKLFAENGTWKKDFGVKPGPRSKFYSVFCKIEKCPMLGHKGQQRLLKQDCICGYHQKPSSLDPTSPDLRAQVVKTSIPAALGKPSSLDPTSDSPDVRGQVMKSSSSAALGKPTSSLDPTSSHVRAEVGKSASQAALAALLQYGPKRFVKQPIRPNIVKRKIIQHPSQERPSTSTDSSTVTQAESCDLPGLWNDNIPAHERRWIKRALFQTGTSGKAELVDNLQLWYNPPQPLPVYHNPPNPDRFFSRPIMVWMPYRLWRVRLQCPKEECGGHHLTGAGLHRRARQVLDVDGYYYLVTETLTCSRCRTPYLSWNDVVLNQLDIGHRGQFRIIMTTKYACDIRVIRLLRERTIGNSPTRLIKQLMEQHTEEWLQKTIQYLTECNPFVGLTGVQLRAFQDPPSPAVVPTVRWLLSVYGKDIMTRVDEVKASITTTFGSILAMDSTRKITKKLAGHVSKTAQWLTSINNEKGEILVSVLTASEGHGLDIMAQGLMKRYRDASVTPPKLIYVDNGCCAEGGKKTSLQMRFAQWPGLQVRHADQLPGYQHVDKLTSYLVEVEQNMPESGSSSRARLTCANAWEVDSLPSPLYAGGPPFYVPLYGPVCE
ncbi:uncharacterized protein LOC106154470 [Lingula anatina]|uniref:Uncharacterized protein LOC106154470 n=1 Tax=Lingula anatina TaxID=7574 RepID=A0A1S3HDY2_LINAN|nr:uncharacterized protein LOC106154470 [Lingula anatina]|eukprot:XP_013384277.1 uncharacterized protein LOC106154470 [Lingula anatina]